MYGKPQRNEIIKFQEVIKEVDNIKGWRDFYRIIGIFKPTNNALASKLRFSIENSEDKGYHNLNELGIKEEEHKQKERYGRLGWTATNLQDDNFNNFGEIKPQKRVIEDDDWFTIEKKW
jgi:hypothetical protein